MSARKKNSAARRGAISRVVSRPRQAEPHAKGSSTKTAKVQPHPAASLFPMFSAAELKALATDISERGLIQPIVLAGGLVLDGRNRLAACEMAGVEPEFVEWKPDGLTPTEWIVSSNLNRRHLSTGQRAVIGAQALDLLKDEARQRQRHHGGTAPGRRRETLSAKMRQVSGKAAQRAAAMVGISTRSIESARALKGKAPDLFERVWTGELKLSMAQSQHRERERRTALASAARAARGAKPDGNFRVLHGDAEECAEQIAPESVDAIVTDPPYEKNQLSAYDKLGRLAYRVLKRGGSLLVMTGQSYLPEVMTALAAGGLQYHWVFAYLAGRKGTPKVFPRRVSASWKPVLWFVKGAYTGRWVVKDVFQPPASERGLHEHQQDVEGMVKLIDQFTEPRDRVLDPFCGSGTTGVAALMRARRFVGIDAAAQAVKTARQRLLTAKVA